MDLNDVDMEIVEASTSRVMTATRIGIGISLENSNTPSYVIFGVSSRDNKGEDESEVVYALSINAFLELFGSMLAFLEETKGQFNA